MLINASGRFIFLVVAPRCAWAIDTPSEELLTSDSMRRRERLQWILGKSRFFRDGQARGAIE
jgi:hypothetical protein